MRFAILGTRRGCRISCGVSVYAFKKLSSLPLLNEASSCAPNPYALSCNVFEVSVFLSMKISVFSPNLLTTTGSSSALFFNRYSLLVMPPPMLVICIVHLSSLHGNASKRNCKPLHEASREVAPCCPPLARLRPGADTAHISIQSSVVDHHETRPTPHLRVEWPIGDRCPVPNP